MTPTHSPPKPYSSLNALRQANDELIANLPDDETGWSEAIESQMMEFMARAIETGTVLDIPADRKVAQGLIDYWVAKPYLSPGSPSAKRPLFGKADNLLKPFDAAAVDAAAERADAFVQSLNREDSALARRILLRLLDLSDGASTSSPKIRDNLFLADETERGNDIVEKMRNAGALVVTPTKDGDLVELRHEALARKWARLRESIEERVKFRNAALFWVARRRNRGALLSAGLAKSAAKYGALTTVEKEFIDTSVSYARQRQLLALGAAVLLVLSLPPASWFAYTQLYVPWRAAGEMEVARSSGDTKRREEAIRWVARSQERLNLFRVTFVDFDLNHLNAPPQSSFIEAILQHVDLTDAVLPAAQFTGSRISNDSHFDKAKLENARFDEAVISDTSFSKSSLIRSIFDRAQLCNVNFSESDLSDASFRDVKYEQPPTFKGTAWWLASGWNRQQVDEFARKFGGRDSNIPAFKSELAKFESNLKKYPDPATSQHVTALDGIAWTYAIYGIDLDKAEVSARAAHGGVAKLNLPGDEREKRQSFTADTLGYILMQKDQTEQALPLLKEAAQSRQNPGAMFRYAIALHASGSDELAVETLALAASRGYVPSHELFLLAKYFSGPSKFVTTFEQHQPGPRVLSPQPCQQVPK